MLVNGQLSLSQFKPEWYINYMNAMVPQCDV